MKRHIGFEIRAINNMFVRKMESLSIKNGEDPMVMTHGWFLGYLYEHRDEDIYQKDLEDKFKLSRSSITCIVKALEKNGCIRRESVDFDARLKKLVILEKGIKIHKQSWDNVMYMENILNRNISDEDLQVFFKVVDQMKRNICESK